MNDLSCVGKQENRHSPVSIVFLCTIGMHTKLIHLPGRVVCFLATSIKIFPLFIG